MIRRNFRTKAGIAAPASSTAANDAGYYSNQATMTGLEENTEYVYRVVNANVKHFFTLLGKMFFTSYGKEFFTYPGKQIFTLYGKYFFT